jgi:hypothetical protein
MGVALTWAVSTQIEATATVISVVTFVAQLNLSFIALS